MNFKVYKKLSEIERFYIIGRYRAFNRNISQTAKSLGIGRTTLYRKLKKYGVIE